MYLGLDLGTTNVKALVADAAGRALAQASFPVSLFHVGEGGVEQDIEEIWRATVSAIRQVAQAVQPGDIRAVGVSSQGGALQMLDANGRPLGRVVSWLDQRGRTDNDAITTELGRDWFARRLGHGGAGVAVGQLLRLRRESPDWLAARHRAGFVGDVIVSRLCGRAAHDGTSASLTLLYNPGQRRYEAGLLERLGVGPEQLPELVSPRVSAGGILPDVARETGLAAGTPVSPAVHDQYAAALGTGAVKPGVVMVGAGTAWVLLAVNDRPASPVADNAFVCHHVEAGLHGQIVSLVNGGLALAWVLELTGRARAGANEIEALLAAAPPGSDGVRCRPLFASGRVAGLPPGTKGRLSGLQLAHGAAHVARATVEGLVFELTRHLELLRLAGNRVEQLVMGGNVAASAVTTQIIADVTGLPLTCFGAAGSLLGAVVLARGLVEPRRSLVELAGEMVEPAREVRPGRHQGFYAERFAEYLSELPLTIRKLT
jgi:sugar (pentulose or hexulose) kinase